MVMHYIKAFMLVFLGLLALEVVSLLFAFDSGAAVIITPISLMVYVVLAALCGVFTVLFLLFGELIFCRNSSFRPTMANIAALTSCIMLVSGIWFGIFSPLHLHQ